MTVKSVFVAVALLLFTGSAFAAEPKSICKPNAIRWALRNAPGIDPSSPASLIFAKAVKVQKVNGTTQSEIFIVQTEDQGGTAKSKITYYANRETRACKFKSVSWLE